MEISWSFLASHQARRKGNFHKAVISQDKTSGRHKWLLQKMEEQSLASLQARWKLKAKHPSLPFQFCKRHKRKPFPWFAKLQHSQALSQEVSHHPVNLDVWALKRNTLLRTEESIWLYLAISLCRVLKRIMATIPDKKRTITREFIMLQRRRNQNFNRELFAKPRYPQYNKVPAQLVWTIISKGSCSAVLDFSIPHWRASNGCLKLVRQRSKTNLNEMNAQSPPR